LTPMFRRTLFWGLTLMLGAVLVVLVLKSRKEERKAPKLVEIVKESVPTATRVILPQDLDIIENGMEILGRSHAAVGRGSVATVRQRVVIRNQGQVAYKNLRLEFAYLNAQGRLLGKRTESILIAIPPGQIVTAEDILIADAPLESAHSQAKILYAALDAPDQPAAPDSKKERLGSTPAR
jgi:hypothetical protein